MGEEQLSCTDQVVCLCTAVYLQRSWTGLGTQYQKDQHVFLCVKRKDFGSSTDIRIPYLIPLLALLCTCPLSSADSRE